MQRIIRGAIVVGVLWGLSGCEPSSPPAAPSASETETAVAPAPPAAAAPAVPMPPAPPAPEATAVLQSLTLGDRACYVTLADAQGVTREEMARMELCELTALVGQPVLTTYGEEAIAAEACQGDPECTQTETVRLLVELQPLR